MRVFRVQKAKYADDISGYGSTLVSGRWHIAGAFPILYTSSNISLAILEYLAHLSPGIKPPALVQLSLEIPDHVFQHVSPSQLPENWNKKGYFPTVQEWGTQWLAERKSLALAVPSIVSPDHNVLINPLHPDFISVKLIETKPLALDMRFL